VDVIVSRTYAVMARRACAIGAVSSAAVHGLMLGASALPVFESVFVVAMMAACLYCAKDLWLVGSPRAWCLVAVMNLGMVAVHWSAPGHHHGTGAAAQMIPASTLMTVATSLSLIEATVATAVLYVQTRRRSVAVTARY
jgi:hypothetical protein